MILQRLQHGLNPASPLHPAVLEWANREAKKRGCGYQTVISDALLKRVTRKADVSWM
jgi:hypothetical protein